MPFVFVQVSSAFVYAHVLRFVTFYLCHWKVALAFRMDTATELECHMQALAKVTASLRHRQAHGSQRDLQPLSFHLIERSI